MQHHYSTVNADEQREALASVIRLFGGVKTGENEASPTQETRKAG
jgi:hypothetical protein